MECVHPHGTSFCRSANCFLASCDPGYYDLNGPWDGCEYACTPTGTEVCDGVDNDCDGRTDQRTCYDGPAGTADVGSCRSGLQSCAGGVWETGCTGAVRPQPSDRCEWMLDLCMDDDCDGDCSGCDFDGDGFRPPEDCNNERRGWGSRIYPGATERCDVLDNDCDGLIDEGCVPTCDDRLRNGDERGIDCGGSCGGVCGEGARCAADDECEEFSGCVLGRCARYPLCGNGIIDPEESCDDGNRFWDDGCGGICWPETTMGWVCWGEPSACVPAFADDDGDGVTAATDCDDLDPSVHPGATEVCDDGIDQNCDGIDACGVSCTGDGTRCTLPNAIGVCHLGDCLIWSCSGTAPATHYADCNDNPVDGCEASFTDPADCCGGTLCSGYAFCISGHCGLPERAPSPACGNGVDDDNDGATDGADLECLYPGLGP
jgi:cysteine-rich repeat protein